MQLRKLQKYCATKIWSYMVLTANTVSSLARGFVTKTTLIVSQSLVTGH